MRPIQLPRPDLWVGAIMIVVLMGTALVSPLYPLYQAAWSLDASQVTQVYVIYMLGALLSLLLFGRLADQIGYRKVMGGALVTGLVGTILSICADDFATFCIARFIVGVAASLITTSGTIGVIRLTPASRQASAPLMTGLFVSGGFALGPLVGGIAGQWIPQPLVSAHLPSLIFLIVSMVAFCFLPALPGKGRLTAGGLVPRLSWTGREHSVELALACCLPFLGFGIFGLYASMAPMLIRNFTGLEGPFISALYIGTFLIGTAIFQIVARSVPSRRGAVIALVLMALGNAVMWANLGAGSVVLFVAGVCIAAMGHGFCLMSSTTIMHRVASDENRGGLTATYWAIGYSGSIFPLLLLGVAADRWGAVAAASGFCAIAVATCIILAIVIALRGRARA